MQKTPVKALIFDMDGVLLHSSPLHDRAYREALASLPIREFDYRSVAGMRTDEAVSLVLAKNGIPATEELVASLASNKTRIARDLISRNNPIDRHCVAVITALARMYPLALASSASQGTVDLFLSTNGLREKFRCVLHGRDVHRAKPAPDIYLLACSRLGFEPSECLVIEDATSGVQAAKAAGTIVWGLPSSSSADELTRAGADHTIASLEDLLALTT
jgi:HAD superfamily hydrolase (TIGR01509 family)